jgi:hypothetical protein
MSILKMSMRRVTKNDKKNVNFNLFFLVFLELDIQNDTASNLYPKK